MPSMPAGSSSRTSGALRPRPASVRTVPPDTAQTVHSDCVTTRSGASASSTASSMPYSSSPDPIARATSSSIAAEPSVEESSRAIDTAGRASTPGGQSHSWLRPTRESRRPSASTISVADGSSETIRMRPP